MNHQDIKTLRMTTIALLVSLALLLMVAPLQVMVAITVLGGLVIALTRYVSLAVLVMFSVAIAWILVMTLQHKLEFEFAYYSLLMAALILIRFRGNIQRLLEGRERRLGETR